MAVAVDHKVLQKQQQQQQQQQRLSAWATLGRRLPPRKQQQRRVGRVYSNSFRIAATIVIGIVTTSLLVASTGHNGCKLYMAPTTIGGIEGNYGMFTAIDLPAYATVLANDGPNIPVLTDDRKMSELFPDMDHLALFGNVWWGKRGSVSDQMRNEMNYRDGDIVDLMDLQINFGAMPNCHPYRSNIDAWQPATRIYDDRSYLVPQQSADGSINNDHVQNPLRGSFSYYTGKHVKTDIPVRAGTELFLDYSSDWKQHGFPRVQDYFSAAALVRKWILVVEDHKKKTSTHSINDKNETLPQTLIDGARALLELIMVSSPTAPLDLDDEYYKEKKYIENGVYELEQLTSRILSLVPQTADDWNRVYEKSWELFAKRVSSMEAAIKTATASVVAAASGEVSTSSSSSSSSSSTQPPGFPSVQDVADAMFEVSQPPPKSIEELESTGICLDHIVAGVSTIPLETDPTASTLTLGRGAMAARFLAEGELIVPVPLLHLLDRAIFDKLPEDDDEPDETIKDLSWDALVINYCFGHSDSTILLCPLTNAVLVNHCSGRNGRFPCGPRDDSAENHHAGPNAVVRWAIDAEWDRKTRTTLTMTLEDLADGDFQKQHRMMSMEIVATRDIQEGEEIFIDYGEAWEEAWLKHLRNWSNEDEEERTGKSWSSPLTLFELNRYGNANDGTARYEDEDGKDPVFYGDMRRPISAVSDDGRFTAMCWYQDVFEYDEAELGSRRHTVPATETEEDEDDEDEETVVDWDELSDEEIIEQYAINVGNDRSIQFTHFKETTPGSTGHFWPCTIVSKHDPLDDDDEDRYLVRIHSSDFHEWYDDEYYETAAKNVLLKNYPRSSIMFMVLPYEGDQYHPKAFRHHIEIPDEIFPDQWKNNKKETEHGTNSEEPS